MDIQTSQLCVHNHMNNVANGEVFVFNPLTAGSAYIWVFIFY